MNRRTFLSASLLLSMLSYSPLTQAIKPRNIIIIGAGLAGLSAGQALEQQGHKVTILEARERIGGRIYTNTTWPDIPLDWGATWIHGVKGNPLTDIARTVNAPMRFTSYDSALTYATDGQPLTATQDQQLEELQERIHKTLLQASALDPDQSIQQAITTGLNPDKLSIEEQRLVNFILNGDIEQEYAGSTEQLSAQWYDEAKAYPGKDALFPKGFNFIVDYLAKTLAIHTKQTVQSIDWSGDKVIVSTNSDSFNADQVIVTLPLGVLKANQVQFNPPLPEDKTKAIQTLGMGVLNKCYLRFDKAFWPNDIDWLEYIAEERGLWTEWFSFTHATNLPVLLAFIAADKARELEKWTDEAIVDSAMQTLRKLYGKDIPAPLGYQITRWASDPFALGSYSFNAVGATPAMRKQLAQPLKDKLFFAGEATEHQHFSTAHGAYISGLRAASELLATKL